MRQLAVLKTAVARGVPKAGLAREVGVPPFVVDKLGSQARRYSPEAIASGLGLLARADRELKGLGSSVKVLGRPLAERVILERVATELIELGSRGRGRGRY
jgi:DNA polymerase III delta subunit